MNARSIHVRFDIDTVTCIERGVPRLLELAADLGARFTFFVNLGHSIDRRETFLGSPARTVDNVRGGARKLGVLEKLGVMDTLRTLIVNPEVGSGHHDVLSQAVAAGHELGLHGGGNHGTWQRTGAAADREQFHAWVREKLEEFRRHVPRGGGFASPGAAANAALYPELQREGFHYSSDDFCAPAPYRRPGGLWEIPVTAHADTVPLVEHLRAVGLGDDEIEQRLAAWAAAPGLKTYYGHPVWEGYRDLPLLRRILKRWMTMGFAIRPYAEALA